jgi:hypothetical protein
VALRTPLDLAAAPPCCVIGNKHPLSERLTSFSSRAGAAAGVPSLQFLSQRAEHAPRGRSRSFHDSSHDSTSQASPLTFRIDGISALISTSHAGPASRDGSRTLRYACSGYGLGIDIPIELKIVQKRPSRPAPPLLAHLATAQWKLKASESASQNFVQAADTTLQNL